MKEPFPGGRRVAAPRLCGVVVPTGLLLISAMACGRSAASAEGMITPQPVRVGAATVAIQLADATAKPVSHASILVEGDMAHPGMAPVFDKANETAPGSYQAHLNFNMSGDWVVILHIKLADGQKLQHQTDVRGVHSN